MSRLERRRRPDAWDSRRGKARFPGIGEILRHAGTGGRRRQCGTGAARCDPDASL